MYLHIYVYNIKYKNVRGRNKKWGRSQAIFKGNQFDFPISEYYLFAQRNDYANFKEIELFLFFLTHTEIIQFKYYNKIQN